MLRISDTKTNPNEAKDQMKRLSFIYGLNYSIIDQLFLNLWK